MITRKDTKIIQRFSFKLKEKHTGWIRVFQDRGVGTVSPGNYPEELIFFYFSPSCLLNCGEYTKLSILTISKCTAQWH